MATKQYTYQIRKIASTPRNKRLTDGIQQAAQSGGGGIGYIPSSAPQYWQLVTTDADGNPLEEAQYYLQPVQGQHLLMPGDVVAYAVDPDIEDIPFPVASYTQKGILSVKSGTGLVIEDGLLSINPDLIGGGGIDTEQLAAYLTQNQYVNQQWLVDNGYLKLTSPLTGYVKPGTYSPLTAEDTLIGAIGKLEANFGNYVDLTTDQTIGGNKTFNNLIVGKDDVVCYAVGDVEDVAFPLASYTQKGILSVQQGTGLLVSNGVLSLDPDYAGGGGVNFTPGTALELTSGGTLNVKIGTTSGTVCAGNDSRLSNDRPNPYSLSWSGYSSGSYDGNSAKSFVIPSNTNQLTNGAGFITGITKSMVLNVMGGTKSSSCFLDGSGNFSIITTSDISGLSTQYVQVVGDTMTGNLTIDKSTPALILSGNRTWQLQESGGDLRLVNNGSLAVYFSGVNNGTMKAYSDILADGDIVAYSSSSVSDISVIATTTTYGFVKYDGSTIGKNSSGQLYVINSGSSGGGTSVSWGTSGTEYAELTVGSTTKRLSVNGHTHTWSQIGSKPSWIGSSKPSYSWSEITSKPSIISSIGYSNTGSSGSGKVVTKVTASGSTVYVTYGTDQTGSGGSSTASKLDTGGFTVYQSTDLCIYRGSTRAAYFSYYNVGTLWLAGTVVQNSDMRLKTVVGMLSESLDKIAGLEVFRYILNSDTSKKVRIGMSAQQMNSIYPEFIYRMDDGYYAMDYSSLSSLAIAGLKELYTRFRPVENKVKVLESKVRNLQARLDNAYREIFNLKEGKETA